MSASDLSSGQWVEIPALPAPSDEAGAVTLIMSIILLLIVTIAVLSVRNRPRRVMLRQLRSLKQQRRAQESRDLLSRIHGLLQRGFKLTSLHQRDIEPQYKSDWLDFCDELNTLRFQSAPPTQSDVERLLEQATDWVRRS